MSTGSLTRVTKPLLAAGLVLEGSAQRLRGTGRPSLPLEVNPDRAAFVGVNITGSMVYAVLTDLRGDVRDFRHLPVTDPSTTAVVEQIAGLVRDWREHRPGLAGVGVALGARVVGWRTVVEATYLGWRDVDLAGELSRRLGLPVAVENDVHAFTQAAHLFGPGRGASSLAVVTLGVGVGAGAVTHDQLLVGSPSQAGAVGHLPLLGGTADCHGSDHVGCAQAELSTSAVEDKAAARLGRRVDVPELLALARGGDRPAREVVEQCAHQLGVLAGTMVAVLGPQVVFLSGDGIDLARAAPGRVREGMLRVAPGQPQPSLVIDEEFSFDAWARGAAATAILHTLTGRMPAVAS
nr:ROK family protein [Auraticoccus cholistanensis]